MTLSSPSSFVGFLEVWVLFCLLLACWCFSGTLWLPSFLGRICFLFFLGFFVTSEYSVWCGLFRRWFEQSSSSDECLSVFVFDDVGQFVFSFLDDCCFFVPASYFVVFH